MSHIIDIAKPHIDEQTQDHAKLETEKQQQRINDYNIILKKLDHIEYIIKTAHDDRMNTERVLLLLSVLVGLIIVGGVMSSIAYIE